MRKILRLTIVATSMLLWGCVDKYDDSELWENIEFIREHLEVLESQVNGMNQQILALDQIITSEFISFISQDIYGNFIISYRNVNGQMKQVTIATSDDIVDAPVIGVGLFSDGIYYWRMTPDGGETYSWILDQDNNMVPVGGTPPEIGIDNQGYWTVNGDRISNGEGGFLLASDMSYTLFRSVKLESDSGLARFVLADGSEFTVTVFETLGIVFEAPVITAIPDRNVPVTISYTVTGTQAANAFVDCFTSYNVTVNVNRNANTLTVRLNPDVVSGNTLILVNAGETTILKPLFFTYGTAEIDDPVLDADYVLNNEIVLEGEMTSFDIGVSANIDYEITINQESADWLLYSPDTKAPKVTKVHTFIAEYYENEAGLDRQGTIIFSNRLYGISAFVKVRQYPVEDQNQEKGISSAADMVAFAAAVNAGATTARWQDDNGDVVLLNDIDMSAVTDWIPINGFTGVLDGKGFCLTHINWTFNMENGQVSYGLFGTLEGTVRNLTLGSENGESNIVLSGTAPSEVRAGSFAGQIHGGLLESSTNNMNIHFAGENPPGILVSLGGLVGKSRNSLIGGNSRALGSVNYGNVTTGKIANEGNGATGMTVGGICAFIEDADTRIEYSVNYGEVSAPTGRGGGLVGTMTGGVISNCENRGLVQDDAVGQYEGKPIELTYNVKRMGGLVGGITSAAAVLEYSTNYGNVFSHLGCRTGGFVGHNNGQIVGCVNQGAILSDLYVEGSGARHGAGWACGFSSASSGDYVNIKGCAKGGYVGDYSVYKDNPTGAPPASDDNAICHTNDRYDPSINN